MSECHTDALLGVFNRIASMKHPVLFLLALGVVVRLAIMSTSMVYDLDYWAVVIRNIEAGNGLYEAEGYYYTPIWGYILGIISVLQDYVLCLGETAVRVVDAFFVEYIPETYYTATAPSIAFVYSIKIPLMIFDVIVAFLAMAIVKDFTGDQRKAVVAFALTFLSPVLFLSSSMIAMPDTIAVMFSLLTILLLRRGCPFIAGMTFSLAVLTKFFPAFLIFIFVAFLFMKNRGRPSDSIRQVLMAAAGALLIAVVSLLPYIIDGNVLQCFQFLSDRVAISDDDSIMHVIISTSRVLVYAAVLILSIAVAVLMFRNKINDPYELMLKGCLLVATLCMVYPPTTQYLVIIVPFLAIWISSRDSRFIYSWMILFVGSLIYVYASNSLTLMPLAAWTDVVSMDSVLDIFKWTNATMVGPISLRSLQFLVGGTIQCLGVLSILYIMFEDKIRVFLHRRVDTSI